EWLQSVMGADPTLALPDYLTGLRLAASSLVQEGDWEAAGGVLSRAERALKDPLSRYRLDVQVERARIAALTATAAYRIQATRNLAGFALATELLAALPQQDGVNLRFDRAIILLNWSSALLQER